MNYSIKILAAIFLLGTIFAYSGCQPYEAEDITLPAPPMASFTYEYTADNPNRVVFKSTGSVEFLQLWDFGNGTTSALLVDTAYFPTQGDYEVTLTVANRGGSAMISQTVNIAQSDASICNDNDLVLLTGGCNDADGKQWTFSTVAGAVIVGPTPGSSQWYTSPENGLAPEQSDDLYHFIYEDNQYDYLNNGLTVYPECGFEAKPFDADPDATWQLSPGTGWSGSTQIILPEGSFIGTKDSAPIYDIISITEDDMLLQAEFLTGDGYFRFTLVKVQ